MTLHHYIIRPLKIQTLSFFIKCIEHVYTNAKTLTTLLLPFVLIAIFSGQITEQTVVDKLQTYKFTRLKRETNKVEPWQQINFVYKMLSNIADAIEFD